MPFIFKDAPLSGVKIIAPRVFPDDRGFFMETYKQTDFAEAGITDEFVQDNHSSSASGVVRGMHYQKAPHAQAKLVRVLFGTIYDVVVDIRQGSPDYGKWFGVELSAENRKMIYVPVGFAHGFTVLSNEAEIHYKASANYCLAAEGGIAWNDPAVGIEWPIIKPGLSEKDLLLPLLAQADNNFIF
ncbi:MAG: dTDP-4-dehydrorhamnose 3,5-epimerase [Victivallaceae bacterium]|nr:dTDP-4-dehydrorhamnose 3,5-epimerase [Victivallaceae bacterium]